MLARYTVPFPWRARANSNNYLEKGFHVRNLDARLESIPGGLVHAVGVAVQRDHTGDFREERRSGQPCRPHRTIEGNSAAELAVILPHFRVNFRPGTVSWK